MDKSGFAATIERMSASDQSFARSLLASWDKYGHLTDKQAFWAGKLLKRVTSPAPTAPTIQNVSRIRQMFASACERLKYPKIWLGTETNPIRLSIAGPNSRHAGKIMVTDGRPYGSNRYYGAIDQGGNMTPGGDLTQAVIDELTAMASDPEGKAAAFGRLTGHCCFCNTALTDDRSIEVGYGPVCAKNFGLAWGAKKSTQPEMKEAA